jgi:nucleoside-diphosphate kinase
LQERTLVLVKPDAYARGLTGEIIARFERKGLFLVAARVLTMTPEIADDHYVEHIGAPFFDGLVKFITSGPLVALVLEGPSAITAARQLIGATNPLEAAPGSIRGDFATATSANLVHGSDGPDAASREIEIFFPGLA